MLTIIGMLFVALIVFSLIALYAEKWHRNRATEDMDQIRKAREFMENKR